MPKDNIKPSKACPGFLSLNILLAATKATEALLQSRPNRSPGGVATPDTSLVLVEGLGWDNAWCVIVVDASAMTMMGLHLSTRHTNLLVILEGLLDRVRWLALALEIIGMIVLHVVSIKS